jgi:hypothetical protein
MNKTAENYTASRLRDGGDLAVTSSPSTLTAPCIWEIRQSTPAAFFDINYLLRGFIAKDIKKCNVLKLTV